MLQNVNGAAHRLDSDTTPLAKGVAHTFAITATTNDSIPRTSSESVQFYVTDPRTAPAAPSR